MTQILHLINEMSPYLLLGFLISGLMHTFIPPAYYTRHLSTPGFASVLKSVLFGIPLPLCSCGVIPTAMSLRKEGASKGAVTAFLIATPQTGVDSIIATYSLMGVPFALTRPIAALLTAILGGVMTNALVDDTAKTPGTGGNSHCHDTTFARRMGEALHYAFVEMMADIGKWLVIGIAAAAVITVCVPDSLFDIFRDNTLMSMLLVLALSVPMYLCATGSIPIAVALMLKGLTPGAALVMLMAGPACNMASILVVRKVMGLKTLLVYILSITLGAVAAGVAVDMLQYSGTIDFLSRLRQDSMCCNEPDGWLAWLCSGVLALLLFNSLALPRLGGHKTHCHNHDCHCHDHDHDGHDHTPTPSCAHNHPATAKTRRYKVQGMNCNHCRLAAEKAIGSLQGVESVSVDLDSKTAVVKGNVSPQLVEKALADIGFEATPMD